MDATLAQQIAAMVDMLPETDQGLAFELVKKQGPGTLITPNLPPLKRRNWTRPPLRWRPGSMWRTAPLTGADGKGRGANSPALSFAQKFSLIFSLYRLHSRIQQYTQWKQKPLRHNGFTVKCAHDLTSP